MILRRSQVFDNSDLVACGAYAQKKNEAVAAVSCVSQTSSSASGSLLRAPLRSSSRSFSGLRNAGLRAIMSAVSLIAGYWQSCGWLLAAEKLGASGSAERSREKGCRKNGEARGVPRHSPGGGDWGVRRELDFVSSVGTITSAERKKQGS